MNKYAHGEYQEALQNFLIWIKFYEKINDRAVLANLYFNVYSCYFKMRKFKKALHVIEKAIENEQREEQRLILNVFKLVNLIKLEHYIEANALFQFLLLDANEETIIQNVTRAGLTDFSSSDLNKKAKNQLNKITDIPCI